MRARLTRCSNGSEGLSHHMYDLEKKVMFWWEYVATIFAPHMLDAEHKARELLADRKEFTV